MININPIQRVYYVILLCWSLPLWGDLFFFSFGGSKRKFFCIFLFVICWGWLAKRCIEKNLCIGSCFSSLKEPQSNPQLDKSSLYTSMYTSANKSKTCGIALVRAVRCQYVIFIYFDQFAIFLMILQIFSGSSVYYSVYLLSNFLDDSANFLCTFCARQRPR